MERSSLLTRAISAGAGLVLAANAIAADDARQILEKMRQVQLERWEGVNSYYIDQTIMGNRSVTYYERAEAKDVEGNVQPYFRTVPFGELQQRQSAGNGFPAMTADDLDAMAGAYRMTGDAMSKEMEQGIAEAGLPPGLLKSTSADPAMSMDPSTMMHHNADALEQMADGQREMNAERQAPVQDLTLLAEKATLVGKENVDGRKTWHIRIDGLDELESADGGEPQEVVMRTSHIWVDMEKYVPLLFKIEGDMTADGQTRPVTIERHAKDFREVPDSRMYEPYESAMRIAGTMTPEQQAEMEKAQKQMQDLEKQLAEMPENQRAMIMQRMGPQLEMMRSMASGNGMEYTTVVNEIKVNPTELPNVSGPIGMKLGAAGSGLAKTPVGASTPAAAATAPASQKTLADAQKACLQEKMEDAQAAQQKKQGFGRLMGAVARTAGRFGNHDVGRVAADVYAANATADDVATAAEELGLTQSDIDACRTPEQGTD